MEHQNHFGKKFYQDKKTGYWISTTSPRIRAHVWVYENHHRNISKGFHIHHIDGNKSNNEISNLQALSVKDHFSKHDSEERRKKNLKHIEEIRPLTKEWHCSEEGIEWHRQHGLKTWEQRQPFEIECKHCLKKSKTKMFHQNFCSNSCKSAWRRAQHLDDEERICPICEIKFIVNKYAKTKTCSYQCGCILRRQKH